MTEASSTIRWERDDDDGIVVLVLDDPNQAANTMNADYAASMRATVERLEAEKDDIAGVVITSAKKTFFAGGDLRDLLAVRREDGAAYGARVDQIKAQLRRLETLGRPVVAAINGAALGGGLEIALAAHHRVIVDDPKAVVGLPEVTLGLLPGAGGVVRTVRMLGIVEALTRLLLKGQRLRPADAQALGLVDEVVATREDLVGAARAWIAGHPDGGVQPWDVRGYKMPGGTPASPALAATLPALPANLRKQLKGANYPAPHHILAAAVEGAQVDIDSAFAIESRYFIDLVTGPVAKNMIQAFFFDLQQVNGDRGRSRDRAAWTPGKVVVLGAGMMGAGIAYVTAQAGIDVVLKDVDLAAAQRGRDHAVGLVDQDVQRGRATADAGAALLARITATADAADAAGADLVIEAVFEDPAIKAQVFAEIEPHLAPDALLASNTSTLPITGLAESVSRPQDFLGLHFFSPVDRMPLLEIIKGAGTGDEAVNRALDVARRLGKTPIVVNDSRGFFTSRVIATFIHEGISMLAEGIPAPTIEQASSQAGYPAPVLQLSDELNLELLARVRNTAKDATEAEGQTWTDHPAFAVVEHVLAAGRAGKLRGAGFYDYADGKRAGLWSGLREAFPPIADPSAIDLKDLEERMLFAEALEAVKCMDEGVIESVADANIGSIMGIGFPGWTGGVLQYINGYAGGLPGFVARAHELAARYGARFTPPASLVERAERAQPYSDRTPLAAAR